MKHAVFLPPFGALADPRLVVELAVSAEERGWDGLFLWDHILRPAPEPAEIGDPWVILTAVAAATTTIRIGPMTTPLVRRRPQKLARETVTLDHLSRGRLTMGFGLGVDTGGELSLFGEVTDAKIRGDVLDEGLELLTELWSGEVVHHAGPHFTANGVRFLPVPFQRPRIPIWLAARGDSGRPVRRAARFDGLFPIEVDADQLARALDVVRSERGDLEGFDVAVLVESGTDLDRQAALGATWAMWSSLPGEPVARVRAMIERGPAGPV
jgi:alkanesulfonate monooxygenase SsuD/methylene tetrahydromethanopterin reductase-like flavin-dependent oxidoreductase (luciferase family)